MITAGFLPGFLFIYFRPSIVPSIVAVYKMLGMFIFSTSWFFVIVTAAHAAVPPGYNTIFGGKNPLAKNS